MAFSTLRVIETLQNLNSFTRTLCDIDLWRDERGKMLHSVGNNVIVVKVKYRGEWCAMRCYMRHVPHLSHIYGNRYFPQEIYVPTFNSEGEWIDVVIDRWIEGVTLKCMVDRCTQERDIEALQTISKEFDKMAAKVVAAEWAHGDISAYNIIVSPEYKMHLIDFDGKFIPSLKGKKSFELGSVAYQPSSRTADDFDAHIDDFSIALISVALRLISVDLSIYLKREQLDGLVFDPYHICNGESESLEEGIEILLSHNMLRHYRMATMLRGATLRIPLLAEIICCQETPHDGGELHLTMKSGFVGYSTSDNTVAIPHIFDDGFEFHEEVAVVKIGNKWIAIDTTGRVIADFKGYDMVRSQRNGVIRAYKDGAWEEIILT